MRTLISLIAIALLSSALTASESQRSAEANAILIADAERAAVTNPYTISIEDNYGNPDAFVK